MTLLSLASARALRSQLAARYHMWQFAKHGAQRFHADPRFDLQNVTEGFRNRLDDSSDDSELLDRICSAYIQAIHQQAQAPIAYEAPAWWQQVRQRSLQPVIQALLTRNLPALRKMYRNFYRDSCSAGLLGAPNNMAKAFFSGPIKDVYRRFYLSHVLYRLDYWTAQTEQRFELSALRGPGVGNPFGLTLAGTHICVGSEYAHYCAQRLNSLLPAAAPAVIAEIGGSFGGMAYYLLRDRPHTKYLDFDTPETIALASYYLAKAFPHLQFLFYGEASLTTTALAAADVVLLPVFALESLPSKTMDLVFSSSALSHLPAAALAEYLGQIHRLTRHSFFHIGKQPTSDQVSSYLTQEVHPPFQLTDSRSSGWHSHKISGAGVGGAAALATSTTFEHYFLRPTS